MYAPKVFLVEPTGFCLNSLSKYGELSYLFASAKEKPNVFSNDLEWELISRLKKERFDADVDYVCVAGNQVCVLKLVLACMKLASSQGKLALQVLMFDSREASRGYQEVVVDIPSTRRGEQ